MKKQRLDDVERVREIQRTSLEMMTVMHRGLSAIAKGELSETGALAMKRLAGQTLDEVQNIALDLSPKRKKEEERLDWERGRPARRLKERTTPSAEAAATPPS